MVIFVGRRNRVVILKLTARVRGTNLSTLEWKISRDDRDGETDSDCTVDGRV